MEKPYSSEYTQIDQSEGDTLSTDDEGLLTSQTQRPSWGHRKWLLSQVLLLLLNLSLALYLLITFARSNKTCARRVDQNSPVFDKIPQEYIPIQFVGNFIHHSQYRSLDGPPSPEVLAAWDRITDVAPLRLGEEDLDRMNISHRASTVKYSEADGGGYMGYIEVFHQLHCVKMLWKHTYIEQFPELQKILKSKPKVYHAHLDHCADVLRQNLMCTGDVNIMTYNWVKGVKKPWPNFTNSRTCKNFAPVLQYALEHEVVLKQGTQVTKTSGIYEEPTMF
ncbi:hypothetical protein FN846DRAFT_925985 [Sphaerosporella brunnea]|uniref:Tat pathway signal sequence n=1 Tax=Sphaerosporella brunnea TaxID=1250544 RepID=A0A5J5FC63_9PEZI|nr:hypothetical protein FN846DRAFT_925985 [Sphaerosporella brunnea]